MSNKNITMVSSPEELATKVCNPLNLCACAIYDAIDSNIYSILTTLTDDITLESVKVSLEAICLNTGQRFSKEIIELKKEVMCDVELFTLSLSSSYVSYIKKVFKLEHYLYVLDGIKENRPLLGINSVSSILVAMGTCYFISLIDDNVKGYIELSIDTEKVLMHYNDGKIDVKTIDGSVKKLESLIATTIASGIMFYANHINIINER